MALAGYKFKNLQDNIVYVRMDSNSYLRRGGMKYFNSEAALQLFMYRNNVIGLFRLVLNIAIRLFVQILIPNGLRKWLFKKLFRAQEG